MKIFSQVLATVALMASGVFAADGVIETAIFGGDGGEEFSDANEVAGGQTVQNVDIFAGERVDGVSIAFTTPNGEKHNPHHGGSGGRRHSMGLGLDEYFTTVEAHMGTDRIVFLQISTNHDNKISGGTPIDDQSKIAKTQAPAGYQLGGFTGKSGKDLDAVGAIWTSIAVPSPPSPSVAGSSSTFVG